jgi:hypothetical protein
VQGVRYRQCQLKQRERVFTEEHRRIHSQYAQQQSEYTMILYRGFNLGLFFI